MNKTDKFNKLRKLAEKLVSQKDVNDINYHVTHEDLTKLVNELEIYQVELDMQYQEVQNMNDKTHILKNKYQRFFQFAPIPYICINSKAQIVEINQQAISLLRLSENKNQTISFLSVIKNLNDKNTFIKHLEQVFANEKIHVCEIQITTREERNFWVQLHSINYLDNDKKPKCRMAIIDLTALREKEKLIQTQNTYNKILGNTSDAIFITDIQGVFCYKSPNFSDFFQLKAPNDPPKTIYELFKTDFGFWQTNNTLELDYAVDQTTTLNLVIDIKALTEEPKEYLFTCKDVTQLKQIEKEKAKTIKQLESIIETVSEGITLSNEVGYFDVFNHRMEEITGYTKKDVNNMSNFLSFLYPTYQRHARALREINELNQKKQTYNIETLITTKNGNEKTLLVSSKIIKYKENEYYLSVYRDISEIKKANDKLKASNDLFNTLIENSPTGIFYMDIDGNLLQVNHKILDFFDEQSKDEMKMLNFLDNKQVQKYGIVEDLKKAINLKQTISSEKKYILHSACKKIVLKYYFTPIFDNWGQVKGIIGNIDDITEDKKLQQQIIENEKKLTQIFENSPIGIAILSTEGIIEFVNQTFTETFSKTNKELVGFDYSVLLSPEIKKSIEQIFQNIFNKKEEIKNKEVTVKLFNNQEKTIILSNILLTIGDELKVVSFIVDISYRKILENDLLKANEEAVNANRSKSSFLANFSHEIKTPMNAIIGFSEILLENKTNLNTKQSGYIKTIYYSANSLLTLINDILDFSKIEVDELKLQFKECNLHQLLHDIKQLFYIDLEKKSLDFIVQISNDLPQYIITDENRLKQILNNLISNAIKFTEKGYIKVIINTQNKTDEIVDLIIQVIDTGVGIPPENQSIIFEPFKQNLKLTDKKQNGTGLGLAITKKLISMFNGEITLKSKENKGTTFTIIFKGVSYKNYKVRTFEPEISLAQKYDFEPATILIVEDIDINTEILTGYLEFYRFELLYAADGEQALKVAQKYKPDLILMDLHIPVIDGNKACKILKGMPEFKETPVIAVTAYPDFKNIERHNFSEIIEKPVKSNTLLEAIAKYLPYTIKLNKTPKINTVHSIKDCIVEYQKNNLKNFEKIVVEFNKNLIPLYQEIKLKNDLIKIEAFCNQLENTAQKYQCFSLLEFIDNTRIGIELFDVEKITQNITDFELVINHIKNYEIT